VNIRKAEISDADRLAQVHATCFTEKWDRAAFERLLRCGAFAFLAGNAAGDSFVLVRVAADEAEILTLATLPAAQRKGLAHALVRKAAAEAFGRGARVIFLEVSVANVPARALYAALGFEEAGLRQGYYAHLGGAAADALTLRARLPLQRRAP
jgi:ribosomal-protein-alanine N-acetyltransferase